MRTTRKGWRYGLVGAGLVLAVAGAAVAALGLDPSALFRRKNPMEGLVTTPVRRTDLHVAMTAAGRVDSASRTVIECQLEALDGGLRGKSLSAGGSSTVLSVLPEGTMARKGDVICALDSSDYEELVRQQSMNVDRARAEHRQAELSLEVAKLGVDQYREGVMGQVLQSLEGQLALSEADWRRGLDRLDWSRRMHAKGYLSKGQFTTEEFETKRMELSLEQTRTALRLFRDHDAPLYLKVLGSDVAAAEAVFSYQTSRLQLNEDRLRLLQKQVELCTIRAPHDGLVIYANEQRKAIRIEEGMMVRQKQKLFYLPDLARMEVEALLHESIVREVSPGMRVAITVEGLSNRRLEGHVESVADVPVQNMFSEVKYFIAMVRVDTVPRGLRPGMTAEVEIRTVNRPNALVIPADAMTVENGQEVCYVAVDDRLERREIKVGQAMRDLLEVTEGVDEGDAVVLDPTQFASALEVATTAPAPSGDRVEGEPAPARRGEVDAD